MGKLVLDRNGHNRQIDITLPDGRVIVVYLADWNEHRVRLAFTAPDDVKILRHELTERDGQ